MYYILNLNIYPIMPINEFKIKILNCLFKFNIILYIFFFYLDIYIENRIFIYILSYVHYDNY